MYTGSDGKAAASAETRLLSWGQLHTIVISVVEILRLKKYFFSGLHTLDDSRN